MRPRPPRMASEAEWQKRGKVAMSGTEGTRPSYAELEAILEQVRAFARQPDARVEDGFDPQFVAGDASCRRGLKAILGRLPD